MPTPNQAMAFAKRFIGSSPVDDPSLKLRILDDAHQALWMRAPWRWSVGSLDPFQLQDDQQDYGFIPPSDILFLQHSKLYEGTEQGRDLEVVAALPAGSDLLIGRPSQVSLEGGSTLRFWPVPTGYGANAPVISILYKKQSTTIDDTHAALDYSTLGIPKEWYWVYQEFVLLKALQFINSPKAGGVTVAAQGAQYSGQHGVVEAAVQQMLRAEKKFLTSIGMEVS